MSYNTRKKPNLTEKSVNTSAESDFDFSGSESEYEVSDSSDTSDTDGDLNDISSESNSNDSSPSVVEKEKRNHSEEVTEIQRDQSATKEKMYVIKSDDYFSHTSQKKVISNNNLDKLETPRLEQNELQKLLSGQQLMIKHKSGFNKLEERNSKDFQRWLYLMHEGFNILLYGLGSKMSFLKQFQEKHLNDMPVVVINGFFPSLSIKGIIDSILCDILSKTESPANLYEACDLIESELSYMPTLHLYVIIHNIEGDMLKNGKAQNLLSKLATIKNIHLLATIDHVSAPLIWDNSKLSKFNFVWFDATSFRPYIGETSYEGSMIVQRSKTLALSSLNNVFLSLTSNSKGIYLIIVKYQLEHGKVQHYQGFLFKDLYWACREAFLVSSDLALRSQLTEFVDHKMLKFKRSADGSEYLIIPTATNILQQFYDEQQ